MPNYLNIFADFFLPRFCPSCKIKLPPNQLYVCKDCVEKIEISSDDRIEKEYTRKFASEDIIKDFVSLYVFEKEGELQQIIHSLKYSQKFGCGIFLGGKIGEYLQQKLFSWNIELIIPIPLHHLKKAERGYNQSFYIAKGLSRSLKIPMSDKTIKRIRYTESQTTMTLRERKENIGGAFSITNTKKICGKNILLLDDVITTGATISECGKILKEKGANNIYACSAAIAD